MKSSVLRCSALALFFSSAVQAAEIDLVAQEVENSDAAISLNANTGERQMVVELNTSPFAVFSLKESEINASDIPSTINIELFDFQTAEAVLDEFSIGSGGVVLWNGSVAGSQSDLVHLAISSDLIQGNVTFNGDLYKIRFLSENENGDVLHTITEVDPSNFPPSHNPSDGPIPMGDGAVLEVGPLDDFFGDDGTIQDVMVAYTPSARNAVGGQAAMEALINLAMLETNTGYANSQVPFVLNLTHTEEVNYTESGSFAVDVNRLQNPTDGFMDNIHSLRDTHFADMVGLIINSSGSCGRAFAIGASESQAFHVTQWNCATGNFTFAHEFGHLQAARHNWTFDPTNNSPFTYNHGFDETTEGWRTIMGLNDGGACPNGFCARLNYWSNPNVLFAPTGTPMGVPDGQPLAAENWLTLSTTALAIANFRTRADQYEPDNTQSQASVLVAGTPQTKHTIHSRGADVDFAKFTLVCTADVTLETSGTTGDTVMSLIDSNGNVITSNDDGGSGLFSKITETALVPGDYFVSVEEFGMNGEIGHYTLSLTETANGVCQLCDGLAVTVDIGAGGVPTEGNDVILGTSGPDQILAGGGNDTVCGLGGADFISGGNGADTLYGDGGNDIIYGGLGLDFISGGNNDDEIYGDAGADTLEGGNGDDLIEGRSGNDTIRGGAGVDSISGGNGNDIISTGSGATVGTAFKVTGGLGADTITGGDAADFIEGGNASDTIYGNGGADFLSGGNGADTIHGGAGADTIQGNGFTDMLMGDGGSDTITGGGGSDVIYGGTANDVLLGNAGNDQIFGEAGNDDLRGGPGNDSLTGGGSSDTCNGGPGSNDSATSCETESNIP